MPALDFAEALAPDDLVDPPDDSVERRYRYLSRCRRVRVGPAVTFVFENRQTLWFRVQELAQVARLTDEAHVRSELNWYSRLLPDADHLSAAVWVAEPGRRPSKALSAVRKALIAGCIALRADDGREIPGSFRTDRVGDPIIGLTLWAEFAFTAADRAALADPRHDWHLIVEAVGYCHASEPFHDAVRASLLDDLV